jgi:DNA-binding winged helix-turn-helix (wHTH) protein/tetratricopeptide (TPR) repeat protein
LGPTLRYRFTDCEFDIDRGELWRAGEAVPVEPQVFELLAYLIGNNSRVVTKDELLAVVWKGRIVSESAITTRINAARSAIGDNGYEQRLIKTVRGRGFRFVAAVREVQARRPLLFAAQSALNKPSLAVLTFRSSNQDSAESRLAANLTEHLASLLCRSPWLSVSAQVGAGSHTDILTPCVRYLVGGSVSTSANMVRVAAQLIDAATDTYLWADHFDFVFNGAFTAQDKITEQLAGAIVPRLERLEIEQAKRAPCEALDARACTLRGISCLYWWTREGIAEALALFRRAIEIDPEFAPAHGLAAYCYVQRQSYGWFTDRPQETADAVRLARDAAQLGVDDALTLSKAAHAMTTLGGDVDCGAALIEQALLCDRHLAAAWYVSGWVQLHLGKPQSAIDHLAHALSLSPSDPLNFKVHAAVAYAHFLEGRYDDGAACAERALHMRPRYQTALRAAAASHALAGRVRHARRLMTSMRRHDPALRLAHLHDVLPLRKQDFSKYVDALHRAGLPD